MQNITTISAPEKPRNTCACCVPNIAYHFTSDVNEASWARGRGQKEWGRGRGQKFFEVEATLYEAEARHVREELSVYEHED